MIPFKIFQQTIALDRKRNPHPQKGKTFSGKCGTVTEVASNVNGVISLCRSVFGENRVL